MVELLSTLDWEPSLINNPCSVWLAANLANGAQLLLDGDGVLAKSDSLTRTKWLEPALIKSIRRLETLRVKVGVGTARGEHFVERLRAEGLLINGVSILEDGQAVIKKGVLQYLVSPQHLRFIGDLRERLKQSGSCRKSWFEVLSAPETFCPGNHQWQGRARASWWFSQTGDFTHDALKMQKIFWPILKQAAEKYNLVIGIDVGLSLIRMRGNNLAIMAVRCNGFEKASAIGYLDSPAVLVADGEGDLNLGTGILAGGGGILGIGGNLDISGEPTRFLRDKADWVIDSPQQLVSIFDGAARLLA